MLQQAENLSVAAMNDPNYRIVYLASLLNQDPEALQPPLFITLHEDDLRLIESRDATWFIALLAMDWREFRLVAAQYYQALYDMHRQAAKKLGMTASQFEELPPETQEEAALRCAKDRATGGNKDAPILYVPATPPKINPTVVRERWLAPGFVPIRCAGRKPKCFFAMFKAFVGVSLLGKGSSADDVHDRLCFSPPFARACGFTLPQPKQYRHTDIPGLRKLEQFDEIMATHGIWQAARIAVVRENLRRKVVKLEKRINLDPTHYLAASSYVMVPVSKEQGSSPDAKETKVEESTGEAVAPAAEVKRKRRRRKKRLKGPKKQAREKRKKAKRKSQSRMTKKCHCPDWKTCPHHWVLADPGAGTVVKGGRNGKRMHWAHKACVIGLSRCGIPLDAVGMTDGASHDSKALEPHLKRLFDIYPEAGGQIEEAVADSAFDNRNVREIKVGEYTIKVRAAPNARRLKTRKDGLPKGMDSLTPTGTLKCLAGHKMAYLGTRPSKEQYLFGPPRDEDGTTPACLGCPFKEQCCRKDARKGRHVTIPFDLLPAINSADPAMGKRFKKVMTLRGNVERAIKRLKCDLSSPQLTRRGHAAFQGHLDKSLLALHLLLRL